jgi:type IV fimbrial biogenesis protein FimT
MPPLGPRQLRGFTLIELLVSIAVVSILVVLAAPSFSDFITLQRLKSVNAELVTNVQYARAEAVSRNMPVSIKFQGSGSALTCYVVLLGGFEGACDCTKTPGVDVCGTTGAEIRTVQVDNSLGVRVATPTTQSSTYFQYDPAFGGIRVLMNDFMVPATSPYWIKVNNDKLGCLLTSVEITGRPTVCSPGAAITGATACPPSPAVVPTCQQ